MLKSRVILLLNGAHPVIHKDESEEIEPATASAFHAACCGVSERILKIAEFLTGKNSLQHAAGNSSIAYSSAEGFVSEADVSHLYFPYLKYP